jgi:hypothetical protein
LNETFNKTSRIFQQKDRQNSSVFFNEMLILAYLVSKMTI